MEMGGKFKEDRSVVSSQLSAVSRIGHKGRIGPIVTVKAPSIESSTVRTWVATSYAAFSICCLRMTGSFPRDQHRAVFVSEMRRKLVSASFSGASRGSPDRRDRCPPRKPLRSRCSQSRTAAGQHSSHSVGCSSLRTAVAGKTRMRRASARLGNQLPQSPLRGQRAESDD